MSNKDVAAQSQLNADNRAALFIFEPMGEREVPRPLLFMVCRRPRKCSVAQGLTAEQLDTDSRGNAKRNDSRQVVLPALIEVWLVDSDVSPRLVIA